MGTEIYGSVEVKMFEDGFDDWFEIIDAGIILGRNYDLFGCLFGVRNFAGFKPLFQDRGAPKDLSEEISKHIQPDYHYGLTWCNYQELLDIDLDELSETKDQRYWGWLDTPKGKVKVKTIAQTDEEKKKCTFISRGEVLNKKSYQLLLELMSVLAKQYGNEGVRLIVYFSD